LFGAIHRTNVVLCHRVDPTKETTNSKISRNQTFTFPNKRYCSPPNEWNIDKKATHSDDSEKQFGIVGIFECRDNDAHDGATTTNDGIVSSALSAFVEMVGIVVRGALFCVYALLVS
jgi:hypothetical protein